MIYLIDFFDNLTQKKIKNWAKDNNITLISRFSGFGNVYKASSETPIEFNSDLMENLVEDDQSPIKLLGFEQELRDSSVYSTVSLTDDDDWWKILTLSNVDFETPKNSVRVRGFDTTVYLMDSGVNSNHPEFSESTITNFHSFTDEFSDNNGHGTALAGLICGKTCSLARPKLKVVKVFDKSTPTFQSHILAALDAILVDFNKNNKAPAIINMSWSIPFNSYINSKIQVLIDSGICIVASAGNSGVPIENVTPACLPDVITVGSCNQDFTPSDFSNYSGSSVSLTNSETNYGTVNVWAPGEHLRVPYGIDSYSYAAGTSMAAAIASGVIAYNLSPFVDSHGNPLQDPKTIDFDTKQVVISMKKSYRYYTGARGGILDLTNDKYDKSRVGIVSYTNISSNVPNGFMIPVVQETLSRVKIVDRSAVSKISSDTAMPTWISIDEYGYASIVHPPISVPIYKESPILINLHLADGTIKQIPVSVLVHQVDPIKVDYRDVAYEDIQLDVTLQNFSGCGVFPSCIEATGCTTDYPFSNCNRSKGTGQCCCTIFLPDLSCLVWNCGRGWQEPCVPPGG